MTDKEIPSRKTTKPNILKRPDVQTNYQKSTTEKTKEEDKRSGTGGDSGQPIQESDD